MLAFAMGKGNQQQTLPRYLRQPLLAVAFLVLAVLVEPSYAFQNHPLWSSTSSTATTLKARREDSQDDGEMVMISRRDWMRHGLTVGAIIGTATSSGPFLAHAEPTAGLEASTSSPLEMKQFDDPQGVFSLRVPSNFFTLRRTQKGDLPDAKTGKGRRGSSIFTAGNMAKAEVIAVERFPTRVLLEENGIQASGDLSTFPAIGDATAVANLIVLRREKETQKQGIKVLDSVQVSPDGKELTFRLKTEIEVQKPELLMEQYGVSQLFRITIAKATLNANDGNILAVFASALEQDFNNGVDGPALEDSVRSFQAANQEIARS